MSARTFSKARRPFGDPVASAKEHGRFIPPPITNLTNLNLPLDIVDPEAQKEALAARKLVFHVVGDTGGIHGTEVEDAIAHAMEGQIRDGQPGDRPLFYYNIGDVVYFNGESGLYREQFYAPYQYYPAPIFAIPGNHDGDTRVRKGDTPDDEPTLYGFMENFCDSQPRYLFPYRQTMTQPYVYWTLQAPFLTVIGLYSNVDGMLDGPGTNEQQSWLIQQLKAADKDACLVIAVHHPPLSLDAVHGGSPAVLDAIDRAASVAKRGPDAVFSGHVHSYQRFTRTTGKGAAVPYVVAGAGGYANTLKLMHQLQRDASDKEVQAPFTTKMSGVVLRAYNDREPGFLRVTVDSTTLKCEYFTVPFPPVSAAAAGGPATVPGDAPPVLYDSFTLDWRNHKISDKPRK